LASLAAGRLNVDAGDRRKDLGVKEAAMGEMAQIPNEIMFAFDSDQLRPNAVNILAERAELIKRDHAEHVRVIDHTDSVGV